MEDLKSSKLDLEALNKQLAGVDYEKDCEKLTDSTERFNQFLVELKTNLQQGIDFQECVIRLIVAIDD